MLSYRLPGRTTSRAGNAPRTSAVGVGGCPPRTTATGSLNQGCSGQSNRTATRCGVPIDRSASNRGDVKPKTLMGSRRSNPPGCRNARPGFGRGRDRIGGRCDWRHKDGNDHRGASRGSRPPGSRVEEPHVPHDHCPPAARRSRRRADPRRRCDPRRGAALARGIIPSLATILVGDDDASAGYIRIKQRQAAELGFASPHEHLPADTTQDDLHAVIDRFNADPEVHGLLIQYPMPRHLDYDAALQRVDPDKDVDGMHPVNLGPPRPGMPGPLPCTPAGIEALLAHYEIPVTGREVVILGRGATLGRPLAMLLSQKRPTANAAVTVVHTGVADWARYTRRADILIAAAGVPGIIQPEHVKPGAVVIGGGVRYDGRRTPARRGRVLRRRRRRDHPAGRRRRPHHRRHALPQRRRRRRAPFHVKHRSRVALDSGDPRPLHRPAGAPPSRALVLSARDAERRAPARRASRSNPEAGRVALGIAPGPGVQWHGAISSSRSWTPP